MADSASPAPRSTALVAGGSGLVGGHLLRKLCTGADVARVIAVSRRPLSYDHPKLANRIVRFESLEESLDGTRADVAFCCLGTTLRSAGSQAAFRAIDYDCVVAFARAARRAGATRFVLNSSVGADPGARNFYLRVKGETEIAVEGLGFSALDIFQPSLLLGWRRELRPLELAAMAVLPLFGPLLLGNAERYRAVAAEVVAGAMSGVIRSGRKGVHRYAYRGIREFATRSG